MPVPDPNDLSINLPVNRHGLLVIHLPATQAILLQGDGGMSREVWGNIWHPQRDDTRQHAKGYSCEPGDAEGITVAPFDGDLGGLDDRGRVPVQQGSIAT